MDKKNIIVGIFTFLLIVTPFIYASLVHDTYSLIVFLYENVIFLVLLILYQKTTNKPAYITVSLWSILFTISMVGTGLSPGGSVGHAGFRDIIIAPSILIQLYMTAIILWKGKNLYKVLSMILILSVIIVSTYITVILAFTVSPQETWLWVHIIHPIFNVPNT